MNKDRVKLAQTTPLKSPPSLGGGTPSKGEGWLLVILRVGLHKHILSYQSSVFLLIVLLGIETASLHTALRSSRPTDSTLLISKVQIQKPLDEKFQVETFKMEGLAEASTCSSATESGKRAKSGALRR